MTGRPNHIEATHKPLHSSHKPERYRNNQTATTVHCYEFILDVGLKT